MRKETWLPIAGLEGRYEVSDLGRVRSLRFGKERILKARSANGAAGHLGVCLPPKTNHYVHRLVALAFLGQPEEGMVVCHNDGDPTNNCVSNLRWGTRKDNVLDTWKHRSERDYESLHAKIAELEARLGECQCGVKIS